MLNPSWEIIINRADELAAKQDASRELLIFYSSLLRAQKRVYDELRNRPLTGMLQEDSPIIRPLLRNFLITVATIGTPLLMEEARRLLQESAESLDLLLLESWREPAINNFFAKAFLQSYARYLVESGWRPIDRPVERKPNRCPISGGKTQVRCLFTKEDGDGGSRDFLF
jgi:hypothetical protein